MALFGQKPKRRKRTDKELIDEFKRRLDSSERHMREVMDRVRRARQVAAGTTNPNYDVPRDPDDPLDWRSRVFPRVAYEKWELKCAELTNERPRVDFSAFRPEFEDNEELAEDAVDYHYERGGFDPEYRKAMRAATRDGGAVIQTTWEQRKQPKFDEMGLPVIENGLLQYETVDEGVCNKLLKLEDVFPDPSSDTFRGAAWAIVRSRESAEDAYKHRMQDGSLFYRESALEELARVCEPSGTDGDEQKRDSETEETFQARRTGVHTIHTMWTPHSRLIVANRSIVLRWDPILPQKHGCIPLTMIRTIEDEDCIVGISMLNLIDALQEVYWHFFNGLCDAVTLAIQPPVIADTEEDPAAAEQVISPNAVLHARGGAQTLKVMQDVSQLSKYDARGMLDLVLELMDRVSGMNAALAGASNADTATEAAINVRQGKGRIGYELIVSDDGWCEVARKSYNLIQQYQSEGVNATIRGNQYAFEPEQLTDMMLAPRQNADERILKDLERQDALSMWDFMVGTMVDPVSQMPQVNHTKAAKRVVRALGGDDREVLPPAPPPAPAVDVPGAPGEGPVVVDESEFLDEFGNPVDPAAALGELDPGVVQPRPEQVGESPYQ